MRLTKSSTDSQSPVPTASATPGMASLHFLIRGRYVKVTFTKDMFKAADGFAKAQKNLAKAALKRDQEASSRALEDLSTNLLAYRTAGRLTGPDAGGDIPSVDEIRRSACRVQGRRFEQKVLERDARLKE